MTKLTTPATPILINNPVRDFYEHFGSNNRILFSGAFGIGKTFFLKEFFEIKEIKEKYNVFHLFPVNYQIVGNEDVFELIKYDILCHLFDLNLANIDNTEFSESLAIQSYLMNNSVSVVSKVLQCVPVLNHAGKAIEILSNIHNEALQYRDKINKNGTTTLEDFFREFDGKKGSVYEFDAISKFIYTNLTNCNNEIEKEKHKKNVLIIDDLDRIDPEHIFRLLNVFSAHVDIDSGTNKFGFDKIIFVCDVANIQNIFAAKYGTNTDFGGYIDKFYSTEVFYFNNSTATYEYIREIMVDPIFKSQHGQNSFTLGEIECITDLLLLFVEGGIINLRQILANVKNLRDVKQRMGWVGFNYYPGYTIIWTCLKTLGGQKDVLINAFEKMKRPLLNNRFNEDRLNGIASFVLPLLKEDILYRIDQEEMCSFRRNGLNIEFKLKPKVDTHTSRMYAEMTSPSFIDFDTLKVVFVEATNVLDKKGLLS